MRLRALEFLELAQRKVGARLRVHLIEADVYSILLDYFEAFPFNDVALQRVFAILATALDCRWQKVVGEKEGKIASNRETDEESKQLED